MEENPAPLVPFMRLSRYPEHFSAFLHGQLFGMVDRGLTDEVVACATDLLDKTVSSSLETAFAAFSAYASSLMNANEIVISNSLVETDLMSHLQNIADHLLLMCHNPLRTPWEWESRPNTLLEASLVAIIRKMESSNFPYPMSSRLNPRCSEPWFSELYSKLRTDNVKNSKCLTLKIIELFLLLGGVESAKPILILWPASTFSVIFPQRMHLREQFTAIRIAQLVELLSGPLDQPSRSVAFDLIPGQPRRFLQLEKALLPLFGLGNTVAPGRSQGDGVGLLMFAPRFASFLRARLLSWMPRQLLSCNAAIQYHASCLVANLSCPLPAPEVHLQHLIYHFELLYAAPNLRTPAATHMVGSVADAFQHICFLLSIFPIFYRYSHATLQMFLICAVVANDSVMAKSQFRLGPIPSFNRVPSQPNLPATHVLSTPVLAKEASHLSKAVAIVKQVMHSFLSAANRHVLELDDAGGYGLHRRPGAILTALAALDRFVAAYSDEGLREASNPALPWSGGEANTHVQRKELDEAALPIDPGLPPVPSIAETAKTRCQLMSDAFQIAAELKDAAVVDVYSKPSKVTRDGYSGVSALWAQFMSPEFPWTWGRVAWFVSEIFLPATMEFCSAFFPEQNRPIPITSILAYRMPVIGLRRRKIPFIFSYAGLMPILPRGGFPSPPLTLVNRPVAPRLGEFRTRFATLCDACCGLDTDKTITPCPACKMVSFCSKRCEKNFQSSHGPLCELFQAVPACSETLENLMPSWVTLPPGRKKKALLNVDCVFTIVPVCEGRSESHDSPLQSAANLPCTVRLPSGPFSSSQVMSSMVRTTPVDSIAANVHPALLHPFLHYRQFPRPKLDATLDPLRFLVQSASMPTTTFPVQKRGLCEQCALPLSLQTLKRTSFGLFCNATCSSKYIAESPMGAIVAMPPPLRVCSNYLLDPRSAVDAMFDAELVQQYALELSQQSRHGEAAFFHLLAAFGSPYPSSLQSVRDVFLGILHAQLGKEDTPDPPTKSKFDGRVFTYLLRSMYSLPSDKWYEVVNTVDLWASKYDSLHGSKRIGGDDKALLGKYPLMEHVPLPTREVIFKTTATGPIMTVMTQPKYMGWWARMFCRMPFPWVDPRPSSVTKLYEEAIKLAAEQTELADELRALVRLVPRMMLDCDTSPNALSIADARTAVLCKLRNAGIHFPSSSIPTHNGLNLFRANMVLLINPQTSERVFELIGNLAIMWPELRGPLASVDPKPAPDGLRHHAQSLRAHALGTAFALGLHFLAAPEPFRKGILERAAHCGLVDSIAQDLPNSTENITRLCVGMDLEAMLLPSLQVLPGDGRVLIL